MTFHRFREFLVEITVFVIALAVYSVTLCRGVYVGDSGELALAAARLQIAHPPGYPLLTNLGLVWSQLLGFLRPIVALNLLSAVAAAASVAAFARWIRAPHRLELADELSRAGAALALAFAATLWSVATNFEVYSLSALLTIIVLGLQARYLDEGNARYLLFATFVFGLGLANHLSILALAPGLVLSIWWRRSHLNWRLFIHLLLALLLPLSLYLYLPIRAQSELIVSWYNPATWSGFTQQVFAETYRGYLATPTLTDIAPYLLRLAHQLAAEFALPLLVLSLVGAAWLFRQNRALFVVTLLTVVSNIALNFAYTISDINPYFLPTIIVLCFWMGTALRALVQRWQWCFVSSLAIAAVALVGNFARSDLSRHTEAENYARDLFDRTPRDGILFCGSDNSMFPALYLRYVENYRPDCEVHAHLPSLQRLWRAYGQPSGENWAHFPQLFDRALDTDGLRIVMARELMNYDNDFPRLRSDVIAGDLIYAVDSALLVDTASEKNRIDWVNTPRIYDPKVALLYCVYWLAAADRQSPEDAAAATIKYRRAAELASTHNDPALLSGLLAHLIDRGERAIAQEIIESTLQNPTLRLAPRLQYLSALGRIQLQSEAEAAAESTYNRILELDPSHAEARFQLGAIRAVRATRSGDYLTAIREYQNLRAQSPNNGSVVYQLAMLHLQLGDFVSARLELMECLRLNFRAADASEMIRQIDERKSRL